MAENLIPFLELQLKVVEGQDFTYYFNFNFIKSVMELLVGKWHILIDALLGKATLSWVSLVWISEYLARLMKLSDISDKSTGVFQVVYAYNENQG